MGTSATITGAAITGSDEVTLTTSAPVTQAGASVGYGVFYNNGHSGLGNLRDSSTRTSRLDGSPLQNWALHSRDVVVTSVDPVRYPSVGRVLGKYVKTGAGFRRIVSITDG